MAGALSLVSGGPSPGTVTISPLSATQPEQNIDTGMIVKKSLTNKIFTYTKSSKVEHRLEFNNVSKVDADLVNGWWELQLTLTYTPDTDIAGKTYQTKIINDGKPFLWMPNIPADTKFQGYLLIREI